MRRLTHLFTPVTAAALCLCLAGLARAQGAGDRDDRAEGPDRDFLTQAFQDGLFEAQMGKQATAQAGSHWVQKFGQRMVTQHSTANQQLLTLLKQKDVRVSGKLDKKNQDRLQKLAKLRGAEFDRAYMKLMVEDHKKAVALFEKEIKNGKDADLKAFAVRALPGLKEHLQLANQTLDKVKNDTGR